MNSEIPQSDENQITREQLVAHLKEMAETPDDLQWDVETKKMIHDWKISRLQSVPEEEESKVKLEITLELAAMCREAGLNEESLRQYRNYVEGIAAQDGTSEKVQNDAV